MCSKQQVKSDPISALQVILKEKVKELNLHEVSPCVGLLPGGVHGIQTLCGPHCTTLEQIDGILLCK